MFFKNFRRFIYVIIIKIHNHFKNFIAKEHINSLGFHDTVRLTDCEIIGNVHIDKFTYANKGTTFSAGENSKIEIGMYCAIGRYVHITSKGHSFVVPTADGQHEINEHVEKDTTLGNYVWIGDHVFIKHGVTIGDYAIIGANTVVIQDVKPFEIVGGVPAKHIRFNTEHHRYKEGI